MYITSNVIHLFIEAHYYLGQIAVARHLAVNTRCLIYTQGGSKTHAEKCDKCLIGGNFTAIFPGVK